jgi:hypothetical protein
MLYADSGQAYKLCFSVPDTRTELFETYRSFPPHPLAGEEARSCNKHIQNSLQVDECASLFECLPQPVFTGPDILSTTSEKVCKPPIAMYNTHRTGEVS